MIIEFLVHKTDSTKWDTTYTGRENKKLKKKLYFTINLGPGEHNFYDTLYMVNEVQSKHLHFPLGKISIHIDSPRFPLCGQSNHHSFWCHMPFLLCFFCLPNSLILSFWICVSQKSQKNLQIQAMEKLRSHIVSKGWANDCCALPFHDQTTI